MDVKQAMNLLVEPCVLVSNNIFTLILKRRSSLHFYQILMSAAEVWMIVIQRLNVVIVMATSRVPVTMTTLVMAQLVQVNSQSN